MVRILGIPSSGVGVFTVIAHQEERLRKMPVSGNCTQVKLISDCFIRPKCEVSQSEQHPCYLGPVDLSMLSLDYIQKGLLFAKRPPSSSPSAISALLDKLKVSLALALVHFYPLAGRFATVKYEDEHSCGIFVDSNKGPGARFIHASALDVTVSDILCPNADVPLLVQALFDLGERAVNYDGHTRALLSIQVTELVDGVFIGCSLSHSLADGTSFSHFLNFWSKIYNSDCKEDISILNVPIFRPLFPDGYGPIIKLPYLNPDEFITRFDEGPLRERIFHFSPTSMATLKARANAELTGGTDKISSFQALSALVWRSITRAQNSPSDQGTTCAIMVNSRPRFDPPLSDNYFGNFFMRARGSAKAGELLGHSLGWAAMLLHQAIASQDDKTAHGNLRNFAESPYMIPRCLASHGPNRVVIGGSARFDMYGPEFGMGRAVGVRTGYANKADGKVTANPGCEGGGSVDLEVCLFPDSMTALLSDQEFMNFVSLV